MSSAPKLSRRALLGGSAATLGAMALGFGSSNALERARSGQGPLGSQTRLFFGAHQAGIEAPPAAYARYLTWNLKRDVDRGQLINMMRIVTDDAARLTQGLPALADAEPEMSVFPANLTVTVGFGRAFVHKAGGPSSVPTWLAPLPRYGMDRLEPPFTGGDFLLLVQSDDAVTVAHASRVFARQLAPFVVLRSVQDGFRRAAGSVPDGHTMRNLFGQVDGTSTPRPGTAVFDSSVWGVGRTWPQPSWLAGGTGLVVRRIRMEMAEWDTVDRPDRERAVGRTLATGAPLTGTAEHDVPDMAARNALGVPVIPDFAHMRRARATNEEEVFFRRGYNYEVTRDTPHRLEAGLVFEAFAYNPARQFVPVQNRLAEFDMLSLWTTPVGSQVFALPPGCREGGYLGETLLES